VFDMQSRHFETIGRGQLLVSQRELSANAEVGRRVVRTTLAILEADPGDTAFLTQEPTQGKTLITIQNYSKYQGDTMEDDPEADPAPTRKPPQRRPSADPDSIIVRRGKKVEEGKNNTGELFPGQPAATTPTPGGTSTAGTGQQDSPTATPTAGARAKSSGPTTAKERARTPWQQLLEVYYDDREKLDGKGPQLDWKIKDRAVAEALLKGPPTWTVAELTPLILKYNRMDDDYARDAGYPWPLFPKKINKLRTRDKEPANLKYHPHKYVPDEPPLTEEEIRINREGPPPKFSRKGDRP